MIGTFKHYWASFFLKIINFNDLKMMTSKKNWSKSIFFELYDSIKIMYFIFIYRYIFTIISIFYRSTLINCQALKKNKNH